MAKGKVLFSCHGDGDSLFDNWYLMHSYHPSVLAKIHLGETNRHGLIRLSSSEVAWSMPCHWHKLQSRLTSMWSRKVLWPQPHRSHMQLKRFQPLQKGQEIGQSIMKQKSTNDCQWAISAGDITSESLHVTISQAEMIRQVYLPTKPNKAQWTMVPCMESKRAWEKSLYCSLFDNVWHLLYLMFKWFLCILYCIVYISYFL